MKSKTVWLDRGWQTAYIGFVPDKESWFKEFKGLKIDPQPYPEADANTLVLDIRKPEDHKYILIVTVGDWVDKRYRKDPASVAALICHEATHCWQHVLKNMGEFDRPSGEVEAYSMQAIFGQLYEAYLNTRIRKLKT